MKNILFIFLFIFFASNSYVYSQDSLNIPKSNEEIFSNLMTGCLESIEDRLIVLGNDKIYFLKYDKNSPRSEFFTRELKKRLYKYKIIESSDLQTEYKILITNLKIDVKYSKSPDNFLLSRAYDRQLTLVDNYEILKSSKDSLIYSGACKKEFSDKVKFEYIGQVEKSNYEFMKGDKPEDSFFQKMLVPGVVVLASLITIVLFYSIRSK